MISLRYSQNHAKLPVGDCNEGHAWFWELLQAYYLNHSFNKAVNVCSIYRNYLKQINFDNLIFTNWSVLQLRSKAK